MEYMHTAELILALINRSEEVELLQSISSIFRSWLCSLNMFLKLNEYKPCLACNTDDHRVNESVTVSVIKGN